MKSLFTMSDRGFSLPELMIIVAIAGTLMAIAMPVMSEVTDSSKLGAAAREIERELQTARLKAVSTNRILRVRLNCPATGYFRTLEVTGTAAIDEAENRCLLTAYPFPAPDMDILTRPNHDGPVRPLANEATVSGPVIQFYPDGSARTVDAGGSAQPIATQVTITVRRKEKTRSMTVNGAGKIQLQ